MPHVLPGSRSHTRQWDRCPHNTLSLCLYGLGPPTSFPRSSSETCKKIRKFQKQFQLTSWLEVIWWKLNESFNGIVVICYSQTKEKSEWLISFGGFPHLWERPVVPNVTFMGKYVGDIPEFSFLNILFDRVQWFLSCNLGIGSYEVYFYMRLHAKCRKKARNRTLSLDFLGQAISWWQ